MKERRPTNFRKKCTNFVSIEHWLWTGSGWEFEEVLISEPVGSAWACATSTASRGNKHCLPGQHGWGKQTRGGPGSSRLELAKPGDWLLDCDNFLWESLNSTFKFDCSFSGQRLRAEGGDRGGRNCCGPGSIVHPTQWTMCHQKNQFGEMEYEVGKL